MVDDEVPSRIQSASRRTRGRPRLEDVASLERELLDVALNEFLKNGYGGTSMATIVKVAGVSKTTLYSRFSSKKELFLAIIQRLIDSNLISHLLDIENGTIGLESGLKAYGNRALEVGSQRLVRGLDRLICSEAHRFPELGEAAIRHIDSAIAKIAAFIEECAVEEGIPCRNPKAQAHIFIRLLRGFQLESLHTDKEIAPDRRKAFVDQAVHTMLCSRKDW